MSRESIAVYQGATNVFDVQLRYAPDHPTSPNEPITGVYTGNEALALKVFAGPGRAPETMAASTVAWNVAADGTVTITLDNTDLAALPPGRYTCEVTLTDGGEPYLAYEASLQIYEGPGVVAAPRHYLHRSLLRIYCAALPDDLLGRYDSGLFDDIAAEIWRQDRAMLLSRAESWARLFYSHWGFYPINDPLLVCMPIDEWPTGATLTDTIGTLDEFRDAVAASLDDPVQFAPDLEDDTAFYAATARRVGAILYDRQVEPNGERPYAEEAARLKAEARDLLAGWTARLDTDADGTIDRRIPPIA